MLHHKAMSELPMFSNGAITAAFTYAALSAMSSYGQSLNDSANGGGQSTCNPINIATGEKYLHMIDYESAGAGNLTFERFYSTNFVEKSSLGFGWRSNFDRKLSFRLVDNQGTPWEVVLDRVQEESIVFTPNVEGGWSTDPRHTEKLIRLEDGWQVIDRDGVVETYTENGLLASVLQRGGYLQTLTYNGDGLLASVTDSFGAQLNFTYSADGLLETMTNPDGNITHYNYDSERWLLSKVIYADHTDSLADNPFKQFMYQDDRHPMAITGIKNELGERIHTMAYDEKGRAILSELGDHAERVDIVFHDAAGQPRKSTVKNALGRETTFTFDKFDNPVVIEGHATASCVAANQHYTYDFYGNVQTQTDWNGVVTRFEYNDRHLETLRVEAEGTDAEHIVQTIWHEDYALPVRVIEPGRTTQYLYDHRGLLVQTDVMDTLSPRTTVQELLGQYPTRTTTYHYNDLGLLAAVDGPIDGKQDTTRFVYDDRGNRTHVINALGHAQITHAFDASGRPLLVEDVNGVKTQLAYNARGWLMQKTTQTAQGPATTNYHYAHSGDYLGQGQVASITSSDGTDIRYEYDKAYRMVAVTNAAGERIDYTLDLEGNQVKEVTRSTTGAIVKQQARVFDGLSRLLASIGADQQITHFAYDANGNLESKVDGRNQKTAYAFDALNRLVATTDAADGVIKQTYNVQGQLASVTDQRELTTEYRYNGFGEKVAQINPDTGETTFVYNEAGQLVSKTDARGVVTRYDYDLLGRMVRTHYPANAAEDVYYQYDKNKSANDFSKGRLTHIVDASGETAYTYNQSGLVTEAQYRVDNTEYQLAYQYDLAGQLESVRYPSGRLVNYERDSQQRVIAMHTTDENQIETVIADEIRYLPFGPVQAMTLGNGLSLTVDRDQDYRIRAIEVSNAMNDRVFDVGYAYDKASNIIAITDRNQVSRSQQFEYDALNRLVVAAGNYGTMAYSYDGVGNRLSREHTGVTRESEWLEQYAYADTSNRLMMVHKQQGTLDSYRTFSYDSTGNMVGDEQKSQDHRQLAYSTSNRLSSVVQSKHADTSYVYNAKGQRVIRRVTDQDGTVETTHYHYDQANQLIAESTAEGKVIREYIYLEGQQIALVDYQINKAGKTLYVHNDHLGTPKLVTDNNQKVLWQADALPFGDMKETVRDIDQPIRFPGQSIDRVTGYHYNYFRDYDPSIGRYIQSDPIGLAGGVNTFGYVLGNPIAWIDFYGLNSSDVTFKWGLYGKGKIGQRGILHLNITLDAGSQNYSLLTGKRFVSQSFELEASLGDVGAGLKFHRSIEGAPIYKKTSIISMLKDVPWQNDSFVSYNMTSMKDYGVLEGSLGVLLGVDATLDFRDKLDSDGSTVNAMYCPVR